MYFCNNELQCAIVMTSFGMTIVPVILIIPILIGFIKNLILKIKSKYTGVCLEDEHVFNLDELKMIDANSRYNRVSWKCSLCGTEFKAHCGLDISPKHGKIQKH